MPLYEYVCNRCDERFDELRPMAECAEDGECPNCGQLSSRVLSVSNTYWGWILTESSHHKGAKDEWVQDRPSNEPIVDREKAPYTKTLF